MMMLIPRMYMFKNRVYNTITGKIINFNLNIFWSKHGFYPVLE